MRHAMPRGDGDDDDDDDDGGGTIPFSFLETSTM
jgi:hypothetical protein